ncbi:MAG: hypothetical protein NZT92_11805 [Abditibacteriales bacterium]|nr:hypothetical protein [Abditibacteriales bacterium]MDW8365516.1 hypothetical protein [Abditibacteriales bacterium]
MKQVSLSTTKGRKGCPGSGCLLMLAGVLTVLDACGGGGKGWNAWGSDTADGRESVELSLPRAVGRMPIAAAKPPRPRFRPAVLSIPYRSALRLITCPRLGTCRMEYTFFNGVGTALLL